MVEQTAVQLVVRRVIRADRETVFDAWVDEDVIRQWWPPADFEDGRVATDPRPGGSYEWGLKPKSGADPFSAEGEYRVVDRPSLLEFTWKWSTDPLVTRVRVEFKEVGEGTEVVLTHTGFPDAELRDRHVEGWEACFDRMAPVL